MSLSLDRLRKEIGSKVARVQAGEYVPVERATDPCSRAMEMSLSRVQEYRRFAQMEEDEFLFAMEILIHRWVPDQNRLERQRAILKFLSSRRVYSLLRVLLTPAARKKRIWLRGMFQWGVAI